MSYVKWLDEEIDQLSLKIVALENQRVAFQRIRDWMTAGSSRTPDVRARVLSLLSEHPDGLTVRGVLAVDGDLRRASVAPILSRLKSEGTVSLIDDGVYRLKA